MVRKNDSDICIISQTKLLMEGEPIMIQKNNSDNRMQNMLMDVIKKIGDKIRDYRTRG